MESNRTEIERKLSLLDEFVDCKVKNDSAGDSWGIKDGEINNQVKNKDSLKRSSLKSVKICNSKFIDCAITGSDFDSVDFIDTDLDGNNLMYCTFKYCMFCGSDKKMNYKNNDFSSSEFIDCKFVNVVFSSSAICNGNFINCEFENCDIVATTLEDTTFDGCRFKNCDMQMLNIEFTYFKNCNLTDVIFPFYQFPFIIGACEMLRDASNKLFFSADGKIADKEQYTNVMEGLLYYFTDKKSFFPAVTICLILERQSDAFGYLKNGLTENIAGQNFRMIRHFCKLGKNYSLIDAHYAQEIINNIDSNVIEFKNRSETEKTAAYYKILNRMILNTTEIRQILMYDSGNKYVLQFNIATNIPEHKKRKIVKLQNKLQAILDNCGQNAELKFIEIRHNSPWDLFIQLVSSDPLTALSVSLGITGMLRDFCVGLNNWWMKRKHKDYYLELIKNKYRNKVSVRDRNLIEKIKSEIKYEISQLNYLSMKNGNISKDIENCTQRITGLIDDEFPDDSFLIFSTKS